MNNYRASKIPVVVVINYNSYTSELMLTLGSLPQSKTKEIKKRKSRNSEVQHRIRRMKNRKEQNFFKSKCDDVTEVVNKSYNIDMIFTRWYK